MLRSRSASSSGQGHEHQLDSYPDTEEDDSDSTTDDHDSLHTTTNAATKRQPATARRKLPPTASSRVSGNSTPLVSPAGSRTFDEHVQKVPQQQSLNLDHLHDSLRKSLTKGSDYARTPAPSSPAVVNDAEREKMVSFCENQVERRLH